MGTCIQMGCTQDAIHTRPQMCCWDTHIHNMLPHDAEVIVACYVYKGPLAATCCAIMTVAKLTGIT